jgi:hypothetical protein
MIYRVSVNTNLRLDDLEMDGQYVCSGLHDSSVAFFEVESDMVESFETLCEDEEGCFEYKEFDGDLVSSEDVPKILWKHMDSHFFAVESANGWYGWAVEKIY